MNLQQSATAVAFVYATDRERALGFYRDVLGLALHGSDDFGDFIEAGHALVRMTVMADHVAGAHPVLGWNVPDIEAMVRHLGGRGVSFTRYDGMGQDALGIWTAPDGRSKVAFFADPDGNVLSLAQVEGLD